MAANGRCRFLVSASANATAPHQALFTLSFGQLHASLNNPTMSLATDFKKLRTITCHSSSLSNHPSVSQSAAYF